MKKLRDHPVSPVQSLTIAPEETEHPPGGSLFNGRICSLDTDLRLRPSFRALTDGEYREGIGEVGA